LSRFLIAIGAVTLFASHSQVSDVTAQEAGSIHGKVTVTGVKNAENVLVFVEKAPGEYPPPSEQAKMDQEKLTFIPHVLPILKGTKVAFANSDPVLHNVFWPKSDDGPYAGRNLGTWGKGQAKEVTFDKQGSVTLLCNVHPEMEGHIVVLQNPFFALLEADGAYEIKDLPPGEYTVKTWYPNPKKLKSKSAKVKITAGQSSQLDFSLSRK
jgi:plastocyanin